MPPRPYTRVPSVAQVVPGAYVHIVLKQDQPTGRTVHGAVQDVLTRGNHPRGIKVRLSDGRVGRVQTMGDANGRDQAPAQSPILSATGPTAFYGESADAPREQVGLDAFIKPAKTKKKRGSAPAAPAPAASEAQTQQGPVGQPSTTTTCPVCGAFEGDEAAVSHHVASHFD